MSTLPPKMRVHKESSQPKKNNTYTSLVYPRWNEASSNMNTPWKTKMEFQKWIVYKEMSFSRGRFLSSMLVFVGVTFESHRCNTFQIYHEILLMEGILHQSIWHLIPLFTGFYTSQVVQDFFHQQYFIGLQQTSWYLVMCLTSCFRESFPY